MKKFLTLTTSIIISLTLVFSLPMISSAAIPTPVDLDPTADSCVLNIDIPGAGNFTIYGNENLISIRNGTTGGIDKRSTLLLFDLSALAGKTIATATLVLTESPIDPVSQNEFKIKKSTNLTWDMDGDPANGMFGYLFATMPVFGDTIYGGSDFTTTPLTEGETVEIAISPSFFSEGFTSYMMVLDPVLDNTIVYGGSILTFISNKMVANAAADPTGYETLYPGQIFAGKEPKIVFTFADDTVRKTAEDAIAAAAGLTASTYTPSTWQAFQAALAALGAVLARTDATDQQINEAMTVTYFAYTALAAAPAATPTPTATPTPVASPNPPTGTPSAAPIAILLLISALVIFVVVKNNKVRC